MPRKINKTDLDPSLDEMMIPGDPQFSQTDIAESVDEPEGVPDLHESSEVSTAPQTDTAEPLDEPEGASDLPEGTAESLTDIDNAGEIPEDRPDASEEMSIPQTDIDFSSDSCDPTEGVLLAQTETETPADGVSDSTESPPTKPKRTRKKAAATEAGENQSQSDSEAAKPARRRRKAEHIVAIDDQRSVETHEDKLRSDLLDLVESLKGKKILTGTIQGVERSPDNQDSSFAVLYHGELKVIIPATETVEEPEDYRNRLPGDVFHYMVTKRLGAEIDYIVKGIDQESGIAAGSRLEAMAIKRKLYYFGADRDGNNLLYEGISAEARIVSVIRAGIFVDLFGLEVYIPLRELSYQRWMDASLYFQPGQRVLAKILSIDRQNRNKIIVQASIKQAGENPYEKALRRYTVGSRYVGTVSMVDMNGVFVSLDGGIDCLCSYPKRGRPPRGSRVTVRILGINHESNRIWGAITHMTTPR